MIKIKNVYFEQITGPLFAGLLKKEWPIKTAYQLARIVETLQTEAKPYFAAKDKLIQKFGRKNKEGKVIPAKNGMVAIGDIAGFNAGIKELQEIEIEISLPKVDLSLIEDIKVSAEEMILMTPISNILED